MNTKNRQSKFVALSLLATPIICLLLGVLGRALSRHQLDDDGADWSLILPYIGVFLGIAAAVAGLVLGKIAASFTRESRHTSLVQSCFLLPPLLAALYMLYVLALNR